MPKGRKHGLVLYLRSGELPPTDTNNNNKPILPLKTNSDRLFSVNIFQSEFQILISCRKVTTHHYNMSLSYMFLQKTGGEKAFAYLLIRVYIFCKTGTNG